MPRLRVLSACPTSARQGNARPRLPGDSPPARAGGAARAIRCRAPAKPRAHRCHGAGMSPHPPLSTPSGRRPGARSPARRGRRVRPSEDRDRPVARARRRLHRGRRHGRHAVDDRRRGRRRRVGARRRADRRRRPRRSRGREHPRALRRRAADTAAATRTSSGACATAATRPPSRARPTLLSSPRPAGAPCSSRPACAAIPTTPRSRADGVAAVVRDVRAAHPGVTLQQAGAGSFDSAITTMVEEDLQRAELISLPITLLILVVAFGALVAACVPLVLGITAVAAAMGALGVVSQIAPTGDTTASVVVLDRPRRRRRLLAVLHPPRAGGAARRPRSGRRAGRRVGHRRPRDPRLRPHRDGRARRAAAVRERGVHLDRPRHDARRGDRRARLAHRAAGDARAARRPDRPRPPAAPAAPPAPARGPDGLGADRRRRDAPAPGLARHVVCLLGALAVPVARPRHQRRGHRQPAEGHAGRAGPARDRARLPRRAVDRPARRPRRAARHARAARRAGGARRPRRGQPSAARPPSASTSRATAARRSSRSRCRRDGADASAARSTCCAIAWRRPRRATETLVTGDAAGSADFAHQISKRDADRHRLRARAGVRAPAVGVPLAEARRRGDRAEPAVGRRRVRRAWSPCSSTPGRRTCSASRRAGTIVVLAAAVLLRDPVRALDGLHGAGARADPRGAPRRPAARGRRGRGHRRDGRDGDERRGRDGRDLRGLRDAAAARHEADGRRPRRRRPARRHARARRRAPGGDHAARRARVAGAAPRPRRAPSRRVEVPA